MKQFGTTILLFLALITGAFFLQKTPQKSIHLPSQIKNLTTNRLAPTQASTIITDPTTLSIPAIGVNASIESVGQDSSGAMAVPQNPNDVAWYNLGSKPGDNGSAVIAGHLDKMDLSPAVFWNLKNLKVGDKVLVTGSDGKTLTFKVTNKQAYPYNNFPLQQVFATNDKPRLNLITCDGTYNRAAASYTQREVVYTELAD